LIPITESKLEICHERTFDAMPEFLDGNYERILQQITIDHTVAHSDIVIIAAGSEQRITLVVAYNMHYVSHFNPNPSHAGN
jgi:hypothetical protein